MKNPFVKATFWAMGFAALQVSKSDGQSLMIYCYADTFSNPSCPNAGVYATGGTAPYSYQWNDPNSISLPQLTGYCSGTYCVTVTDAAGAQDSCCVMLNPSGIQDEEQVSGQISIQLLPNPLTEKSVISISRKDFVAESIAIYDCSGKLVRKQGSDTGNAIVLQKGDLAPGLYVLLLTEQHGSIVSGKLMIR